jgi:hypothetical protein
VCGGWRCATGYTRYSDGLAVGSEARIGSSPPEQPYPLPFPSSLPSSLPWVAADGSRSLGLSARGARRGPSWRPATEDPPSRCEQQQRVVVEDEEVTGLCVLRTDALLPRRDITLLSAAAATNLAIISSSSAVVEGGWNWARHRAAAAEVDGFTRCVSLPLSLSLSTWIQPLGIVGLPARVRVKPPH